MFFGYDFTKYCVQAFGEQRFNDKWKRKLRYSLDGTMKKRREKSTYISLMRLYLHMIAAVNEFFRPSFVDIYKRIITRLNSSEKQPLHGNYT